MEGARENQMKKHTAKLCIKAFSIMTFVLLGVYSAAMAAIELCMGKDHITGYFSDIVAGNDYPLFHKVMYGMNTSIGVAVLTVIAALFLVCVSIRQYTSVSSARPWFECSQVLFFLFAACDERFMIHEKLGHMTHVDDSVYVGLLGVLSTRTLVLSVSAALNASGLRTNPSAAVVSTMTGSPPSSRT